MKLYAATFLVLAISLHFLTSTIAEENERKERKYSPIRRTTKTTTPTSTSTTESANSEESLEVDDEEKSEESEEKERVFTNARGGPQYTPEEGEDKEEKVSVSPGNKRYVEFTRPGATEKPKTPRTTTTKAPKRRTEKPKNVRPDGCNKCRFYCKQCSDTEEVTSGGTWGCCNHNCCGGRCACEKFK